MSDRDTPVEETQIPAPKAESASANAHRLGAQVAEFPGALVHTFRRKSLSAAGDHYWNVLRNGGGLFPHCHRMGSSGLLGSALAPPPIRVLLVPAGAGLVVAFLVQKFFPGARGSGVNQTKAAVYVFDGYVPFRTVIGKFLTCSLAIGSGQSLGPEDPSLQMGAGIASALGRRLKLSRDKLRLLAPVGAAAGLAAAFNAPISAVCL